MAIDWSKITHFKKEEFGENADKLNFDSLLALNNFRELADTELIVTSAYREGDTGEHGKGVAFDIIAPNWAKTPYEFYKLAVASRLFNAVGIYSGWRWKQKPVRAALHVDNRQGKFATWVGVGHSKASNQYYAVNASTIKQFGLDK